MNGADQPLRVAVLDLDGDAEAQHEGRQLGTWLGRDGVALEAAVVEDHHEALPVIYSHIGRRRLPFHGSTLVHVDSHPDMGIPEDLRAEQALARGPELFDEVDIGDWILPAVYARHMDTLVWLRPDWAVQMADGVRRVAIGAEKATGLLRVFCPEAYFLMDEVCVESEDLLDDVHHFDLYVAPLTGSIPETIAVSPNCIVDVCLDTFCVNNPFRHDFETDFGLAAADAVAALYGRAMTSLERHSSLDALGWTVADHKRLMALFNETCESAWAVAEWADDAFLHRVAEDLAPVYAGGADEAYTLLSALAACMLADEKLAAFPADELHMCGLMYDLPHHRETDLDLVETMATMLACFPKPNLITVARSSIDYVAGGSTSSDQLQECVLTALHELYGEFRVRRLYGDNRRRMAR